MPIGSGIIYNEGDLILSQVSGSGNTFLETKIAAATSSIVYFDNTARINSASLNSITVGTASYVSGSTSIITNLTASNISASGTGSFGIVGIGTTSPAAKLDVSANAVDIAIFRSSGGLSNDKRLTITSGGEKVIFNVSDNSNTAIARAYEFQNAGTASMTLNSTGSLQVVNTGRILGILRAQNTPQTTFYDNTFAVNSDGGGANGFIYTSGTGGTFPLDFYGELILQSCPRTGYNNGISLVTGTTSPSVKLRVAENGNVGIGTTLPSEKLHVVGNGLITSGSAVDFRIDVSGTGNASLTIDRQTTGAESKILLLDGNVSQWGIAAKASSNNFVIRDADSTERFTILKSGGNVGIGTSSPASKLHISGSGQTIMRLDSDTTSSVSQFQIKAASDAVLIMGMLGGSAASTNFGVTAAGQAYFGTSTLGSPHPTSLVIGNVSNIPIAFSTNNVERMRIDGGGNVGIGTTTVSRKLHTYVTTGPAMRLETSGSNASIEFIPSTGHNRYNWLIGAQQNISDAFEITPSTATNGTTFSTPSLLVKSDGNVGIGTTNPTARLHVSGSTGGVFEVDTAGGTTTLYVSASGNVGIGTTNPIRLLQVNSDALIYANVAGAVTGSKLLFGSFANTTAAAIYSQTTTATSGDLIFAPMSASILTEFVRIQSTGNVGIGTASPADKLHVIGNIRINGGDILNWGGQAFIQTIGANDMFFRPNSTLRMILTAAGNLGLGNGFISPAYLLDVSGSSRHGYQTTDTHQFTGSVSVSGSLNATASWASNALTASSLVAANSYTITNLTASNISASGTNIFGNVGIGTTVPGAKLDVNGDVYVSPNTAGKNTFILSTNASNDARLLMRSDVTTKVDIQANGTSYFNGGNVGIGTTSPTDGLLSLNGTYPQLNINNPSTGSGVVIQLRDNGRAAGAIGHFTSTNYLQFSTAGQTAQITLTNIGSVGIGTTNPNSSLQVSGSVTIGPYNTLYSGTGVNSLNINATNYPILAFYVSTTLAGFVGGYSDHMSIYAPASKYITFEPGDSEKMRITAAGNVGIGTSSPAQKLEVQSGSVLIRGDGNALFGTYYASAGENTFFTLHSGSGNTFHIGNDVAGTNYNTMVFTAAPSSIGGSVGIGTTSPGSKLQINDNTPVLTIRANDGGSSRKAYIDFYTTFFNYPSDVGARRTSTIVTGFDSGTWGTEFLAFNVGSGSSNDAALLPIERVRIDGSGNVGIGTTSPIAKLQVAGNISGSSFTSSISNAVGFLGTSSWANNAVSASYATTAQTANALNTGNSYTITGLTVNGNISASGTISASKLRVVGIANVIELAQSAIGSATYYVMDNTVETGGRRYRFGYSGASADKGSFTIYNATDNITPLTILTSGSVGIGTTSPAYKLDVIGGTISTDSELYSLGGRLSLYRSAGDSFIDWSSGVNLGFRTETTVGGGSASEKMRIQTDGNVGIGTTSPAYKLDVNGSVNANNIRTTTQIGGTTGTIQSLVTPGIYSNGLGTGNAIAITSNTTFANQGAWANLGLHQTTANANDLTAKVYLAIGGWYQNSGTGLPVYIGGGYTSNSSSVLSVVPVDTAGNGNVGIGTAAPAAKLEISGSSNSVLMNIKSPISGAILYVSGSGAVGIGTSNVGAYTLQVNGSFAATTKSFVIEHPTKAGKKLIYGSLESPYHGIRLTGRDTLVNGKCKIQLPDYIYKLILHDSVNIQLTGIKCNKTLYVDEINIPENYFTIAYDKGVFESYKDYDFFWDFTAIRADVPELTTEL